MSFDIKTLKKEANKYYERNKEFYEGKNIKLPIVESIINNNDLKCKSILEIGCSNGIYLNSFYEKLKPTKCVGLDISSKAILSAKRKFPKIDFYNYSSLQLDKLKCKFDLIICGFFLYLMDRNLLFKQFDQILSILNKNGYLIINDYDPLFPHYNSFIHNPKLYTFKSNYSALLESTGLFKLIYKIQYDISPTTENDKSQFISKDINYSVFKMVDFKASYPRNPRINKPQG